MTDSNKEWNRITRWSRDGVEIDLQRAIVDYEYDFEKAGIPKEYVDAAIKVEATEDPKEIADKVCDLYADDLNDYLAQGEADFLADNYPEIPFEVDRTFVPSSTIRDVCAYCTKAEEKELRDFIGTYDNDVSIFYERAEELRLKDRAQTRKKTFNIG